MFATMLGKQNILLLTSLSFCLLSTSTKTITGPTCTVIDGITGICVPLDQNAHSFDCRGVYGFLVTEVCEQQLGGDYANVMVPLDLTLGLLMKIGRTIVAYKSNAPPGETRKDTVCQKAGIAGVPRMMVRPLVQSIQVIVSGWLD